MLKTYMNHLMANTILVNVKRSSNLISFL